MQIYEINIPGIFHHRVAVTPEGRVKDPHVVEELRKKFFDYEHGYQDEHFNAFLSHLKMQYPQMALTEVPYDQAGSKLQSSDNAPSKEGLMVAFFLPPATADAVSQHGGEKPEDLHLTLAFCGPRAELQEGAFESACDAVQSFIGSHGPIQGHLTGTGRFSGQAGTAMGATNDCIYASFSSPALATFREDLVRALEAHGVGPRTTFGYTPHITLRYVKKEYDSPIRSIPRHDIVFDTVTVCCGPHQRKDFKLSSPAASA